MPWPLDGNGRGDRCDDFDGDGLNDWWEVLHGPDPRSADPDGLRDADELVQGTNPKVVDTDGDGFADGYDPYPVHYDADGDGVNDWVETISGTDPMIPTVIDPGQSQQDFGAGTQDPRHRRPPSVSVRVFTQVQGGLPAFLPRRGSGSSALERQ